MSLFVTFLNKCRFAGLFGDIPACHLSSSLGILDSRLALHCNCNWQYVIRIYCTVN